MPPPGGLLDQIRNKDKHVNLNATETIDKSGPVGVSDANQKAAPPPRAAPPPGPPPAAKAPAATVKISKTKKKRKSASSGGSTKVKSSKSVKVSSSKSRKMKKRDSRSHEMKDLGGATELKPMNDIFEEAAEEYERTESDLDFIDVVEGSDKFLVFVYLFNLLAAIDFAIVLPSMYHYVFDVDGDYFFYGSVFGVYALGQFLSSFLFGRLSKSVGIDKLLLLCSILVAVGNLVYMGGGGRSTRYSLVIGRLLSGVGGGLAITGYSYIISLTPNRAQRSNRIVSYRFFELIGTMTSPLAGALMIQCDFLFFGTVTRFNVAASLTILCAFIFFISLIVFKSCQVTTQFSLLSYLERKMEEEVPLDGMFAGPQKKRRGGSFIPPKNATTSQVLGLLYVLFILIFTFWSYLATLLVYFSTSSEWNLTENYYLIAGMGVCSCFMFASAIYFKLHRYREKTLMLGVVAILIGSMTMSLNVQERHNYILYGAFGMVSLGFSASTMELPAIFSLLTDEKRSRAHSLTWFYSFIALGRFVGPIFGAWYYEQVDFHAVVHLGCYCLVSALLVGLLFLLQTSLRSRLQVVEEDARKRNMTVDLWE